MFARRTQPQRLLCCCCFSMAAMSALPFFDVFWKAIPCACQRTTVDSLRSRLHANDLSSRQHPDINACTLSLSPH